MTAQHQVTTSVWNGVVLVLSCLVLCVISYSREYTTMLSLLLLKLLCDVCWYFSPSLSLIRSKLESRLD